jgi:hypothetical protein
VFGLADDCLGLEELSKSGFSNACMSDRPRLNAKRRRHSRRPHSSDSPRGRQLFGHAFLHTSILVMPKPYARSRDWPH